MQRLDKFLHVFVSPAVPTPKRGRPLSTSSPVGPLPTRERSKRHRRKKRDEKVRRIAILDMETDPFDNVLQTKILPFLCVIYSDDFEPIVIWDDSYDRLCQRIVGELEALPHAYTIYAHNGGRFDFMFLLRHIRGKVSFKGRGIMCARLGKHELRDSFHIIPERLANWQKDSFDYTKIKRSCRTKYKDEIIAYCLADCRYLLAIVKPFIEQFGFRLSIGQAAMYELGKHYKVKKFSEGHDAYIRQFYYGGRVECVRGRGCYSGDFKLYDVNSMYPYVMAHFDHPTGNFWDYTIRAGAPGNDTVFVDVDCLNHGAFVGRCDDGSVSAGISSGRFFTTIHEYTAACELGRISNVRVNYSVDCKDRSNFSQFVRPLYDKRAVVKQELARLQHAGLRGSVAWNELKKDDIFLKLLLNNAYGKFAQDPRRYKEHWITDVDEMPPKDWLKGLNDGDRLVSSLPEYECRDYWLWSRPAPGFRFNNVGVAASITGAARAVLLRALAKAVDPIYCDTDSIICRSLCGVIHDSSLLGGWNLEDEFSDVLIVGKKLYACRYREPKQLADGRIEQFKIRSKGSVAPTWEQMQAMLRGESIPMVAKAPTLDRYGDQYYITRNLTATAPFIEEHSNGYAASTGS